MNDDVEVVCRVVAGDVDSFRTLVERYEGPLFQMLRNLIQNLDDREDIAQDVFLAAYTNLHTYDPAKARFSTWLFTIARNKCINALKGRKPVVTNSVREQVDPRTPDEPLNRNELFEKLDRCLAGLPLEQRTSFVLSELQGLSLKEISQIEGVALGTVKSRIHRAKGKLRSLLGQFADPD